MKNQAIFSSKNKSKKCRLLQFLFGALRVEYACPNLKPEEIFTAIAPLLDENSKCDIFVVESYCSCQILKNFWRCFLDA